MSVIDKSYQNLCKTVLSTGKPYKDISRDTLRLQIPSYTFRHDFKDGFPALSLKKLYWKGIIHELIWFLRGDTNIKYLVDNNVHIWDQDAYNFYTRKCEGKPALSLEEFIACINSEVPSSRENYSFGDVGKNYSAQWRNFNGQIDQIENLIVDMKENIMSTRLRVTAWNPSELSKTALPPCHSEFQIIGVPLHNGKYGFELHWNQRSSDVFLGIPFNIASYATLAKTLEKLTGYKALAIEGTLKCVHFYENQIEAAVELTSKDTNVHPNCELDVSFDSLEYDNITILFENLKLSDFSLVNYSHDATVKVEMLAPKS